MAEKLTLDSELLQPLRETLEISLNKMMGIVVTADKEAEITLKINLDTITEREYEDNAISKEWKEPRLEIQVSEKIKEDKNTTKGYIGRDYSVKVDEETNEVFVEKVNKQIGIEELEVDDNGSNDNQ